MNTFAVDFETYYDNECSIRTLGLEGYAAHPDFDAYLVSVYGDNFAWVGAPEDAPWDRIAGHRWVSHNRSFDEGVHSLAGPWKGVDRPREWHCTADLSAYSGYPRDLFGACKASLGVELDKSTRDAMKGKRWEDMEPAFKEEVAKYALYDSKGSFALWEKLEGNWPEHEREVSRETTRMCWAGVPVNSERLGQGIEMLHSRKAQAIETIPWEESEGTPLSSKAWAAWVRSRGKVPPDSMAKDDIDTLRWVEQNPEEGEVLEATWVIRGSNSILKKLQTMEQRVRSDGYLPFDMKYFGAQLTGRDSGSGGFNVQNFPREEIYGVDMRGLIEAPEGKRLVVADLSQIEARALAWLAGEEGLLELAASGKDWYQAVAEFMSMFSGENLAEEDPELRRMMKAISLGCQFGMSGKRFSMVSKMGLTEASRLVSLYRKKNPNVVALWKRFKKMAKEAGRSEERVLEVELPSGRTLRYDDVDTRFGTTARVAKQGGMQQVNLWHGLLTENATQALARDIFMDRIMVLVGMGILPCLRVHDEGVFEVDEADAPEVAREIERVFTTPPDWINIPLGADVKILKRYAK